MVRTRMGNIVKYIMATINFHSNSQTISMNGNDITINGNKIFVDGKDVTPDAKEIKIEVVGDIKNLQVDYATSVNVSGNAETIKNGSGDLSCGNVSGHVSSGSGNVKCGSIGGNVSTGSGNVKVEGPIKGSVKTGSGNIKYNKA